MTRLPAILINVDNFECIYFLGLWHLNGSQLVEWCPISSKVDMEDHVIYGYFLTYIL